MRVSLLLFSFFLIHSMGAVREPSASYRLGRIALRNIPKYTHINGTEIWLKLDSLEKNAIAPGPGPAIIHAPDFEYLCKVFYCHNENKRYCEPLCTRRALQFDYKSFFDRLDNINSTEPTPNKEACLKDCIDLCGPNDCKKQCVDLVDIHFEYKNRKEMHLSLLLFSSCLLLAVLAKDTALWKDTIINLKRIPNFFYVNGVEVVKKLDALEEVAFRPPLTPGHGPEYEYLCRLFYCHNENKNNCNELCTEHTKKVDDKLVDEHIRSINSSQPWASAGKKECDKLVQIHFSFENRVEYEQEVKELFKPSEPFLFWKGALVTLSMVSDLKHIDAWGIIQHLKTFENTTDFLPENEYLCRIAYCHNEHALSHCGKVCAEVAPRIDHDIIEYVIRTPAPPAPSKDACKMECSAMCGKNDCKKECSVLCAVHFSYDNRKQYESDFKRMFMRIFD
ncbi:hypothetical protein PRIPAC_90697 [Pristionchus pacificus]|uniref:Uncharacterized protein n=1 Tax=Pristionchus pacificus TaxID=54126 RepID=A0A2A6B9A2_PRIPA|nr:hypothetical protein PRIPAC_90697 [Pristionchus pacificus]|eukprot:PDM62441.1 hypothetical protein PRIPAC_51883 [Pristionchus pacificus]